MNKKARIQKPSSHYKHLASKWLQPVQRGQGTQATTGRQPQLMGQAGARTSALDSTFKGECTATSWSPYSMMREVRHRRGCQAASWRGRCAAGFVGADRCQQNAGKATATPKHKLPAGTLGPQLILCQPTLLHVQMASCVCSKAVPPVLLHMQWMGGRRAAGQASRVQLSAAHAGAAPGRGEGSSSGDPALLRDRELGHTTAGCAAHLCGGTTRYLLGRQAFTGG